MLYGLKASFSSGAIQQSYLFDIVETEKQLASFAGQRRIHLCIRSSIIACPSVFIASVCIYMQFS